MIDPEQQMIERDAAAERRQERRFAQETFGDLFSEVAGEFEPYPEED